MRIGVATDHAGFALRVPILRAIEAAGHTVVDLSPTQVPGDDYPDAARALGELLQQHAAERGVLVCGSGVGASVAASKLRGIRAAVCHDTYSAHQGVEHDDMNVLVLGARVIGVELAGDLVRAFLGATFSGEERHARRLAKIAALEG